MYGYKDFNAFIVVLINLAQNSNFVPITTKITAQDANGSGLNNLQYQISSSSTIPKDTDSNWKNFTNGATISEDKTVGTWYLYTKVTDNAGNRATDIQKSNPYTVNYSVSYDANGGTGAPNSQIKEPNKDITLSTTKPSRTGYTFIGWSTNKNSSTAEYQPGAIYSNNESVTLYAVWKAKQVEVTFVRNTSSTDNTSVTQTFTYGVTGQKFSDKGWTKTGYTLLGWNKDRNASTQQYSPLSGVSDSWINSNSPKVTIYAIWKINSYSLTVNPNGGTWNNTTENSTITQNYGTTKTIANPTPPAGYKVTFNGNGGSTPDAQTSTKSFASWTNSGSGTLSGTTYTFGAGNGTLTANYKNNAITLPTPTRTGYTFAGWYDAASGGNKVGNAGATYTPTATKTLYAHWTVNQYTLTVNPNGGTWNNTTSSSSIKQNYGSTKTIANPTPPAGYKVTFNGNGGSTPSAITSTKSFTSWTKGGSGTLSGATYTFGAGNGTLTANYKNNAITLPSTSRNGYTFLGWYDAASGGNKIGNAGATYTPTTAKTLYAHWQDKTLPTMGTLTASTTAWTNGNVTLTGKARDLGSGISYYQFSTNGGLTASSGGWVGVTNTTAEISRTHTVTSNGTYYFYIKDASGNVNKKAIAVTNIDKTAPTVSISPNGGSYTKENYENKSISIKLTASDSGGSGLSTLQYAWSTSSSTEPTSGWTNFTNGANRTISSSAGKYYLWTKVTDKAGNRATSVKKSNQFTIGGWQKNGSYWYYYSPSTGGKLTGFQYVLPYPGNDRKFWFYLDPNNGGRMLTGWQKIDGQWFYFKPNPKPGENEGEMLVDWQLIDGKWYYFKKDGDGTNWSGRTGSMEKGWQAINGYWYYLIVNPKSGESEGQMAQGWYQLGSSWYYLKKEGDGIDWSGPTGSMLCNREIWIVNKWYHFDANGVCTNP